MVNGRLKVEVVVEIEIPDGGTLEDLDRVLVEPLKESARANPDWKMRFVGDSGCSVPSRGMYEVC